MSVSGIFICCRQTQRVCMPESLLYNKDVVSSRDKALLTDIDNGLVALVELLEAIDENKAAAKLNEVSMIGNNGRRIYY